MTRLFQRKPAHAAMQISICAAVLFVIVVISRFTIFRNPVVVTYAPEDVGAALMNETDRLTFDVPDPKVAEFGDIKAKGSRLYIPVKAHQPGSFHLDVYDANGETLYLGSFQADRFGTVFDSTTGNFTGDTAVTFALTAFWFAVAAIMFWHYLQAKGPSFYSYSTIYFAGFSLFALSSGIMMLLSSVRHALQPDQHPMYSVYHAMSGASSSFIMITSPAILIFSIAMAASNIALLRHERPRFANLLGLLIPFVMVAGAAFILTFTGRSFAGSVQEFRIRSTTDNVLATIYVYFECMLAGSVICGLKAARHRPGFDKDYILILGCRFFKDGTLTPLLKGRVDAALSFWKAQKEATGKEAVFIPSGGQGADETMPEAEAMRRYLLSEGVPDALIRPETESKNTYQNMAFSKKIIEAEKPDSAVLFSTTNYHVYRSGLWAQLAGLPAEGIGGKTKWWFWPNAFMREVVGLLQNRIKQEVILLLLIAAYFTALSMLLPV